MMRRTLAAAALLAAAVTVSSPAIATAPTPPNRAAWMRTPCQTEDSVNCYWNAHTMGNGTGHSFYVRRMPHTGKRHPLVCLFYVAPRQATNDQCWRYDGGGM